MTSAASFRSIVETTDPVEPTEAFEFWRATALAPFGNVDRRDPRDPFSARRLTVASSGWVLTHTRSSAVGLEFTSRHVDRAGSDMVVVGLAISGVGYQEQAGRGVPLGADDVSFLARNLPLRAGTQSDYEEIRLAVPRSTFEGYVGSIDRLVGSSITDHAATAEFRAFLRGLAASLPHLTHGEAESAVGGALHLLSPVVERNLALTRHEPPQAAVEALARAHIMRRLHEADLDPADIRAKLGVSRSALYRAFARSGGIAAAIREARLDLAHRKLIARNGTVPRVSTVAHACGFADIPTFNRGFRKRFGMSPRDAQAVSCGRDTGEQAPAAREAD